VRRASGRPHLRARRLAGADHEDGGDPVDHADRDGDPEVGQDVRRPAEPLDLSGLRSPDDDIGERLVRHGAARDDVPAVRVVDVDARGGEAEPMHRGRGGEEHLIGVERGAAHVARGGRDGGEQRPPPLRLVPRSPRRPDLRAHLLDQETREEREHGQDDQRERSAIRSDGKAEAQNRHREENRLAARREGDREEHGGDREEQDEW
jgi:hypothetical protein